MKSLFVRSCAIAAAVAAIAALSGSQAVAWPGHKPAPAPVVVAPPPPPPPPPITVGNTVAQAAAAYEGYVRQAIAVSPAFTEGGQVQSAMQQAVAYEPKSLSRDMVAYAAVIALQDPTFVAGVRQYAKDPAQRAMMINQLFTERRWAMQMPGADAAAGLIVAKLNADGEAIAKVGGQVKQAAYDIQREKWSKEMVANRDGRLALARRLSETAAVGAPADSAVLMQAAVTGQGMSLTPGMSRAVYTDTVVRGMAVAALAVLGAAGDDNAVQLNTLMDESSSATCLNLAKLNLYQCLAVAKPHYEDVFCMGQHVLIDTGRCVQGSVGTAPHEEMFTERMAAKAAADEAKKAEARAARAAARHSAPAKKHR